MLKRSWFVGLAALAAACHSTEEPLAPIQHAPVSSPESAAAERSKDRGRHDRLARRLAKALRDESFRQVVFQAVRASKFAEGKVHLQQFMSRDGGETRRRFVALSGDPSGEVAADLDQGSAIEVYLPVAEHRRRWAGDQGVLVASAETEAESPVAYDLMGRRLTLSPGAPPTTPVLAVNRAETRFDTGPSALVCTFNCGGGGGGGGTPSAGPGLYMTQTSFNGTFEGWLKGDPEFEVHILGPATPGSEAMTTYQCAGGTVGGPYYFDQNSKTWTGNVLLFSQAQLDQYKLQNPAQGFRVVIVEDDDTACEIKIDSTRAVKMLDAIKLVYGNLTGARDTTVSGGQRIIDRYHVFCRFLKAAVAFFKTNDDPVGNAVADPFVASTWFSAANWVMRGENSAVNGAIRLEMK